MAESVKTIPSSFGWKNLSNLLLPARNYRYLLQAEKYFFDPDSQAHSAINAWWLAELSLLAYEDAATVRTMLDSVTGLESNRFVWFESRGQGEDIGTHGYGFDAKDFAVVCFRGTEFYPPEDIVRQPSRLM